MVAIRICTIFALVVCILGAASLPAQTLGITKGFKVLGETFGPPHETQPRSLLEAATAQILTNDNFFLTGLRLQTFRETGERELSIQAPDCLFNRVAKTASSPGSLRLQTADGKFMIEGEGFLWNQTESSLIISNRVHTLISSEVLKEPPATAAGEPSGKAGPIEIVSDYFEYSRTSGMSFYRRNVRVSGTNEASLTSQLLAIKLPMEQRQLESIRAEQDVRVDYSGVQASGQEALYSANTGIIRMTGEPAWRAGLRQGRARELAVDRTNKVFRAEGDAWLRTPARGMNFAGLLSQTNAPAPASQSSTNQFLEVTSDSYEFRTNWAVFHREVKVSELIDERVRGTMTCGLLSAHFKGSNQLETLTATTNVMIKDGTNWLSCDKAVLTGSNAVLEATGSPAWGAGTRTGKGNLVRIDTRASEMLVRGNASLQFPARELAESAVLQSAASNARPGLSFATNDFAQIFCEEYTLRPDGARFRGGVYATHPRMNWICESLSVEMNRSGGQKQTLVAERGVKFQLRSESGDQMDGEGDKAVYVYGIEGSATNDLLTLTGAPAMLHTTNGIVRNDTIIYDRVRNVLRTPGRYSISGTNRLENTNLLILPKRLVPR